MFYIVRKRVGERVHSMYFESWRNAEKYMTEQVEGGRQIGLWHSVTKERRFLPAKGFEEYNIYAETRSGEKVVWSLLDGQFSDHIVS